ncbi:MAG: hypothetical protein KatS3mg099_381 [Candidatus Parcubacteria bacterium]|nr:MAG: hypothetical protein KatS3mg099_381 [Candidatus Parcubacteria bacterium]
MTHPLVAQWLETARNEIGEARVRLASWGITLEEEQPFLGGEQPYIQNAATARGWTVTLFGRRGKRRRKRVVVKIGLNEEGCRLLRKSREAHEAFDALRFAYEPFSVPRELIACPGAPLPWLIVYEYMPQERAFTDLPPTKQFAVVARALRPLEETYALMRHHLRRALRTFGITPPTRGEEITRQATALARETGNPPIAGTLEQASERLAKERAWIEMYHPFLTHPDFVPHNFRVTPDGTVVLLDVGDLEFGNKHTGWARLALWAQLHSPVLARAIYDHFARFRPEEEQRSFDAMRIARAAELLLHYLSILPLTEENSAMQKLTRERIALWHNTLRALLEGEEPPEAAFAAYRTRRDALRDDREKSRQQHLYT